MKTFRISWILGVTVVLAILSNDASAQRGGMMGMMQDAGKLSSELLAMEEVQKELKLNDDQKKKLVEAATKIAENWRAERRELMMSGGDEEEIKGDIAELLGELQEEEKELVGALDDDQKKRLSQLRYQRMGAQMFRDKEALEALTITDKQKESIGQAFTKSQETVQGAMQEARDNGNFSSMRETFTKLQTDLMTSITEVLTDEQKEKFKEMQGQKFEFPQPQRRERPRNDF